MLGCGGEWRCGDADARSRREWQRQLLLLGRTRLSVDMRGGAHTQIRLPTRPHLRVALFPDDAAHGQLHHVAAHAACDEGGEQWELGVMCPRTQQISPITIIRKLLGPGRATRAVPRAPPLHMCAACDCGALLTLHAQRTLPPLPQTDAHTHKPPSSSSPNPLHLPLPHPSSIPLPPPLPLPLHLPAAYLYMR